MTLGALKIKVIHMLSKVSFNYTAESSFSGCGMINDNTILNSGSTNVRFLARYSSVNCCNLDYTFYVWLINRQTYLCVN